MRDFVDFIKNIVKDCNEEVDEQDIGDKEVDRHGNRGDPFANHTLLVTDVLAARRVDLWCEHLTVKHKVRLEEHLEINGWVLEIKKKIKGFWET